MPITGGLCRGVLRRGGCWGGWRGLLLLEHGHEGGIRLIKMDMGSEEGL